MTQEQGDSGGKFRFRAPGPLEKIDARIGKWVGQHPLVVAIPTYILLAGLAVAIMRVATSEDPQPPVTSSSQPLTPEQLAQGRIYRADIQRVAREFVGDRYQAYGMITDSEKAGTDSDERWAHALYGDTVTEFVAAGPQSQPPQFHGQSWRVSNSYDRVGTVAESFLSTGRAGGPEEQIRTAPLVEMGILPPLYPADYIPGDKLPDVTRAVFNLPPDLKLEKITICYGYPMSTDIATAPGLLGRARLGDGRELLVRSYQGSAADLWVNSPGRKLPDIHSCSGFDHLRMAAEARWWDVRSRARAKVNNLIHS